MSPSPHPTPLTIGWRERIDLPDWGIRRLAAKVDTGARTSAIHVENIEYLDNAGRVIAAAGHAPASPAPAPPHLTVPDHAVRARFDVMLHRSHHDRRITIEADLVRTATVRPSHGRPQHRPIVETTLVLGPVQRRIQLSLVSRRDMLCRMLLGRTALDGFTVNPAARGLLCPRRPRRAQAAPTPAPGSTA